MGLNDKETPFLDLNMKVVDDDIHTSDKFGFSTVNFPCLSGDVARVQTYSILISQLIRIAIGAALAF